ncbi:cell envelope integrity protein CreD [Portibacter lacus]|uniref:Cell envelope integrity protein CreD n=1 Tax=Portibacter lacus TaxID=1099794 RepID=A0AA37SVN7_9BACT|nr:cell envelope integrity protein CreD [Portibacter lacus]GLR20080.1 cell envelope integrity protein CreD [Portibacter lacus]
MQQQEKKGLSQVKKWMHQSVSLKLFTISILGLCLLIPSAMVKNIIHERSGLNYNANLEVRSKWALAQNICAPILSVPVIQEVIHEKKTSFVKSYYHFLPEDLNINSQVTPQNLRRGIYEVIVYNSVLKMDGSFSMPEEFDAQNFQDVLWEDAFITVGISDLRGIKNDVNLKWNEENIKSTPGSKISGIIPSGLSFPLSDLNENFNAKQFDLFIDLQGSEKLTFIPLGKNTNLSMQSPWDSPSFTGSFLPDDRIVEKDGFTANWKVLQLNRNFPQHWQGEAYGYQLKEAAFGVDFILPSDAYQKSIRSIKYALMNIALTFLIFFIVEVFTKVRIHPFQYIMVGLSIILFYILLVSVSEHLSFDKSYLISGTAVIGMIYLYSLSVFKSLKFSLYLLGLSILNYGFIYITLQMTDYALLLGAVSMTIILAGVMYGTRNIDWYNLNQESLAEEQS